MNSIELDNVWNDVGSQEFNQKYLENKIPAIAKVARMKSRVQAITLERDSLYYRIEKLKQNHRHNELLPAELYSMITDLTNKVNIQEARQLELEQQVILQSEEIKQLKSTLKKQSKHIALQAMSIAEFENERILMQKQNEMESEEELTRRLASLEINVVSCNMVIWDTRLKTVTFKNISNSTPKNPSSSTSSSQQFATYHASGSTPLSVNINTRWQIEVIRLPQNNMFIGVIGNNTNLPSISYASPTAYGWHVSHIFNGGQIRQGEDTRNWSGWRQSDKATFKFEPSSKSLFMSLDRTGVTYSLTVPLEDVFIHVSFGGVTGGVVKCTLLVN